MDLANDEILMAIDLAKKSCIKNNRQLDGTIIQAAMEEVLRLKKESERKSSSIYSGVSIDESQVRFIMDKNLEKVKSLEEQCYQIIEKSTKKERLKRFIEDAKYGKFNTSFFNDINGNILAFKNEIFGTLSSDISLDDIRKFLLFIQMINKLERENYYAYCQTSAPEVIEAEMGQAIGQYEQLRQMGSEMTGLIDVNRAWSDYNVPNQVHVDIERTKRRTVHNAGLKRVAPVSDFQYAENHYPPEAYDSTFEYISLEVFARREHFNKGEFNEASQIIDDRIRELSNMSIDEYRAQKVQSMALSAEEQMDFDNDLRVLIEEKETSKGHSV